MIELKNYRDIRPGRKCQAEWFLSNEQEQHEQQKKIVSTQEFAEKTGFPLRLIRDYCRAGYLTCWRHGDKKFLIDYDRAVDELYTLTVRRHRNVKLEPKVQQGKKEQQQQFLEDMKKFKESIFRIM